MNLLLKDSKFSLQNLVISWRIRVSIHFHLFLQLIDFEFFFFLFIWKKKKKKCTFLAEEIRLPILNCSCSGHRKSFSQSFHLGGELNSIACDKVFKFWSFKFRGDGWNWSAILPLESQFVIFVSKTSCERDEKVVMFWGIFRFSDISTGWTEMRTCLTKFPSEMTYSPARWIVSLPRKEIRIPEFRTYPSLWVCGLIPLLFHILDTKHVKCFTKPKLNSIHSCGVVCPISCPKLLRFVAGI